MNAAEKILIMQSKKARAASAKAVSQGLFKPAKELLCENCGKQAAHLHHPSYAEEDFLNVIPLCRSCHRKQHPRKNTSPSNMKAYGFVMSDPNSDFDCSEYITKVADEKFDGNKSMALRQIIKEHADRERGWKWWQKGAK